MEEADVSKSLLNKFDINFDLLFDENSMKQSNGQELNEASKLNNDHLNKNDNLEFLDIDCYSPVCMDSKYKSTTFNVDYFKENCSIPEVDNSKFDNKYFQELDLDNVLNSPDINTDKLSFIPTESKQNLDGQNTNLEDIKFHDAVEETRVNNVVKDPSARSCHKISFKSKSKSLIGLRKVQYNNCIPDSKELLPTNNYKNSETIYFATHPAAKFPYKRLSKKNCSTQCKKYNEVKIKCEKRADEKESSYSGNKNNQMPKLFTLPIGHSGCSISFPATADVDIRSFAPQLLDGSVTVNYNNFSVGCDNTVMKTPNLSNNLISNTKQLQPIVLRPQKECLRGLNSKKIFRKSRGQNSNPINLRNILKIEIYTKPPKKMVITKCHDKNTNLYSSHNLYSMSEPKLIWDLSKLSSYLKESIPNLSPDLLKKLSLPTVGLKRSCLTTEEFSCIEKQAQLLIMLDEMKLSHTFCTSHSCDTCKSIKDLKFELAKLQDWNNDKMQSDEGCYPSNCNWNGKLEEKFSDNDKIITSEESTFKYLSNKTEGSSKESVTLLLDEGPSHPVLKDQEDMVVELGFGEDSKQWKEAMLFKERTEYLFQYLESKRSCKEVDGCSCKDECRSFLYCKCISRVWLCEESCSCRLSGCENLFKTFLRFPDIQLISLRGDHCLLQFIHELSVEELEACLESELVVPCCQSSVKLHQIIPCVALCPHCSALLSYSWCRRIIQQEEKVERNHCSICCKCQPVLLSHCYLCETCTHSTVDGQCLECDEEKINFVINLP